MENLKKNLHYFVFAAGIVVGGVLLFVGITIRGGKEEEIESRARQLQARSQVQTKGELEAIERRRTRFNEALKDARNELVEGKGVALRRNLGATTDPQNFRAESDKFVDAYRARFNALAKPAPLPERMRSWTYRRLPTGSRQESAWDRMTGAVYASNDPQMIAEFRKQQRILREVCIACEALVNSGRFGSQGVELRDFNFEPETAVGTGVDAGVSPWRSLPFVLRLDCSPEFALALTAELTRQTATTAGPPADRGRIGFPMQLEGLQMMHVPRPLALRYVITNEMKQAEGIDPALNPATEDGRAKVQQKIAQFEDEMRPALPMEVALRLNAHSFNPDWRAVAEEPQQ